MNEVKILEGLSKRTDELAAHDSLAFSVQCVSSVFNIGQCLLVRTREVESLTAVVTILREEIRGLKTEK